MKDKVKMKLKEMFSEMCNSELYEARKLVDREIRLSNICIKEGQEVKK